MVGQRLGHYKILEKLGAGGMGEVYRAEDTTLKRQVALKVLPADLASSQERLERFQREAETLAALDHPNIVHIYTVEESEGVRFLTMELVDGKSLDQVIPSEGLPLKQFFDLSVTLADALAEAHEQGIVHRDLKPANIMIDHRGRPKILDFGIAKLRQPESAEDLSRLATEAMTEEGKVLGTYPYMSPEQVEGKAVDHRSDLFSFGTVLYEMATGKRPFKGDSPASLMSSILRDTPEEPDAAREELPHHLDRILSRCLEKDPDDRYQRAKDLRKDLEELRQEVQTGVQPLPRPAVTRPTRRKGGVIAGICVLALLIVAVVLYVTKPWEKAAPPAQESRITSLAVLPLENLSGDPEQEYFVDGMHEALTAELSRIGALTVISRTSAMRYKGVTKPLPEIARELRVNGLIEGSVAREGDQVRISVQLIHGPTDEYLWSDSYQRELRSVLALQSEVARAIAEQIQVTLTPEEADRLAMAEVVDPEAYEDFLKGQYQYNKLNAEGWEAATGQFQQSIEKDPSYAPAHAMLSFTYSMLAYYSVTPPAVLFSRALAEAERALALDDSLAEAHASLSFVRLSFDWDWAAADRASQEALRLNPNSTMALLSRALFLTWMGRHEEAIAIASRTVELDPVAPHVNNWLGMHYFLARRYDEAIEQLNKVIDLEPDYYDAHNWLSYSYAKTGRVEEAGRELTIVKKFWGDWSPIGLWAEALILALVGKSAEAHQVYEQIPDEWSAEPMKCYVGSIIMCELGDKDRAFALLEQAYHARSPFLSGLKVDPRIDCLRDDPRFEELFERMNFPE